MVVLYCFFFFFFFFYPVYLHNISSLVETAGFIWFLISVGLKLCMQKLQIKLLHVFYKLCSYNVTNSAENISEKNLRTV